MNKTSNRLRIQRISPSTISVEDINRILTVCNSLHLTAKEFQYSYERALDNNRSFTDEKLKENLESSMIVTVGVWGNNGDYLAFRSVDEILAKDLPDKINMVQIDNNSYFKYSHGRDPLHYFSIVFDCENRTPFDLSMRPSSKTPNLSELKVMGVNPAWVEGSYATLYECLEPRKHKVSWLFHLGSIYDILLWLLFAPVFCSLMSKLDYGFQTVLKNYSQSFSFILYLLIFLVSLVIFRLTFGIVRWLLPYIEFKNHSTESSLLIRKTIVTVLGIVGAGALYDFAKWGYTLFSN